MVSYPEGGIIFGYQPGQMVEVFYDPEHPSRDPVISDLGAVWGSATFAGLIGLGFAFVGGG